MLDAGNDFLAHEAAFAEAQRSDLIEIRLVRKELAASEIMPALRQAMENAPPVIVHCVPTRHLGAKKPPAHVG